ncbi:hypothetical protein PV762_27620 [Mitsuaria sp. CC2]|jgi:hypothetical protein|uniref:hypothetical protein n=1 Tax=Mitsuaria sp. CC2 TaxID=3029186 RepID=UPI003B8CAF16
MSIGIPPNSTSTGIVSSAANTVGSVVEKIPVVGGLVGGLVKGIGNIASTLLPGIF